MDTFKDQQIEAAVAITAAYTSLVLFYTILVSLTQAGKTGTYHKTIQDMIHQGTIQHAYILCGSNEKELKIQAINDAKKYNLDLYTSGRVEILFRQDFKQGKDFKKLNIRNALIVIDESHLDQNIGSELHQLLSKNGLTLDGNQNILQRNNTFILSVSATPYSELAAYKHKETVFSQNKHIIQMKPGEGYYGIEEYERDGPLFSTYDIIEHPELFAQHIGQHGNMWSLIRLPSSKKGKDQETVIHKICNAHGYKALYYTSKVTEVAMTRKEQEALQLDKCLKDAPNVPTVVILHGRLRAGKVVPKEFVNLIWEGAEDSKTDSIVQGLLGRMCGYKFGAHKPTIFVPDCFIQRNKGKACPHSELERTLDPLNLLPRNATNLTKSRLANEAGNGKTPCPPIRLTLTASDNEWLPHNSFDISDRELGEYVRAVLMTNPHLVLDSPHLSQEQKKEILEFIPKAYPHVRKCGQVSYYTALLEAHKTNTSPPEHFSGFPEMGFVFWNTAYTDIPQANKNHLYVVFITKAKGFMDTIHLKSRIPMTNGKSIFTSPLLMPENCVAVQPINISADSVATVAALKITLQNCIRRWVEDENVQPYIKANGGLLQLKKRAFHYKDGKVNDVQVVCRELEKEMEAELMFKIGIKPVFGRSGDNYFNIKEIKWDLK